MKNQYLKLTVAFFFLLSITLNAQTPEFWGMTESGGKDNKGVIFKTNTNGNHQTVQYSFIEVSGANPWYAKLFEAPNGKLYGMTRFGGSSGSGVLFEFDPATSTYTKKLDFDGAAKGRDPLGSLMQATNGKLYGMTRFGGSSDKGVLFEYNLAANSYTKKLDFDGAAKGKDPYGNLVQATNGKLYGMTVTGGTFNKGVLFEYDPLTSTYTKKLDFDGAAKGKFSISSLIQATNGKLYGMTRAGGSSDKGVLFEYDPATSTYTKKLDFDGSANGHFPQGDLIQATNGKLYGMTRLGGTFNLGVLFEYDPATNSYTKKLDFDGLAKGENPLGSLMQATNGKLYGMTSGGGLFDEGVLFEYNLAANMYTKKLDFDGATNGKFPFGSLIEINRHASRSSDVVDFKDNNNFDEVIIWPNPSNRFFNLKFSMDTNVKAQIRVYDISGRLVHQKENITNNTYKFGESLKSGIYFVNLTLGDKTQFIRLVKY